MEHSRDGSTSWHTEVFEFAITGTNSTRSTNNTKIPLKGKKMHTYTTKAEQQSKKINELLGNT